jgi:hypothetical protein
MAIVSVGYDGTVDEVQIAKMFPSVGASRYGVVGAADWKVSAHPSTAQAVTISAGSGWGSFVFDTSDTVSTVQCDAISPGSTRWDLITVKRDWQPVNGTTTFSKVTGGSTQVLPARLTNRGVQDEQPLALVQWTGGQTQPTAIIDLRCWAGNGGLVAKDELVKSYLDIVGASVYINGIIWRYIPGANDVPGWVAFGDVTEYPPIATSGYTTSGSVYVTAEGTKRRITVDLTFLRTGADTVANYVKNASWTQIATVIPTQARGASSNKYFPANLIGGGNNIIVNVFLNPLTGAVSLRAVGSDHSIQSGAQFSMNLSYYI